MMPVKRRDYTADSKDVLYNGTYFLGGKFVMLTSVFEINILFAFKSLCLKDGYLA